MSKETNISGQVNIKNHPKDKVYTNKFSIITDVIDFELTTPLEPIRLTDIKLTSFKKAFNSLRLENHLNEEIGETLFKNTTKVKSFITKQKDFYLNVTSNYVKPQIKAKGNELLWVNEDIFKDLDIDKYIERKSHVLNDEKSISIQGYAIKDYEKLVEAIKVRIPQNRAYGIYSDKSKNILERVGLDEVLVAFSELAKELNIEPSGNIIFREITNNENGNIALYHRDSEYVTPENDPNIKEADLSKLTIRDIRASDSVVYSYVLLVLIRIIELNEQETEKSRGIVNIKNANEHDVIKIPTMRGLTDMIDGAFEGREFKRLFREYRKDGYGSNKEIISDGGWLVHINPQQTEIDLNFDETDQKTLVKFMTNVKAIVIDVTTALDRYFRDHPDRDPNEYIKLTDIARYIDRFNDSKLKRGELRQGNRQQILNGLQLAQLISADYVVGKDKKGNREWRKVYLLDRITDYKTYSNTDTVVGVKVDFTKEYKESGAFNLGVILDGVLSLNTAEYKALGAYILERFAQFQEQTVKGKPQKITAETLIKKAGIVDSNITNKLKTLQKALDVFVEKGLIAKWECKNGAKNITNYDKESQTIYFYPTDNLINSYAPKSRTQAEKKAIKLEQKNRLKKLQKWFKGYTSRKTASNVLGLSVAELDELLAGNKIINDDILNKINDEM